MYAHNIFIIGRLKSLKVQLTLIICLVLKHIALLVTSLVVARNWSLAWAWHSENMDRIEYANYIG